MTKATYAFRCTNENCVYHTINAEYIRLNVYGKFCKNCVFYDKKSKYCLKKQKDTKPLIYCVEYVTNPDELYKIVRYCHLCGSTAERVPSSLYYPPTMLIKTIGGHKIEEGSLEDGTTKYKITHKENSNGH